jgi:metal-responsive CopG/Arc/MetJ family transcriptional regulator
MKYVQISFDEKLLNTIDNIAVASQLSRSALVRKVLRYWIQHREIKAFENEWIEKLEKIPDDSLVTVGWLDTEHWGEI